MIIILQKNLIIRYFHSLTNKKLKNIRPKFLEINNDKILIFMVSKHLRRLIFKLKSDFFKKYLWIWSFISVCYGKTIISGVWRSLIAKVL